MQESSSIISINNDLNAPINTIADYVITGDIETVIPKMIKYYRKTASKNNYGQFLYRYTPVPPLPDPSADDE